METKNTNMDFYNKVREVPKEAQKEIGAGRLKGMTDINPMWRIKTLTENFGMCGIGWYFDITDKRIEQGANDEKVSIVDINLFIKQDGEWSKPIAGTGGSKLANKESAGLYTSDECYKMALTDAISVACKNLGIGADVYYSKDRTKYDLDKKEVPVTTKEEAEKIVITFGKHKDKTLKVICEEDSSYVDWLLENEKTDEIIKQALRLITGKKELTEEEKKEQLELMAKIKELVNEGTLDAQEIKDDYNVKKLSEMTTDQMKEILGEE